MGHEGVLPVDVSNWAGLEGDTNGNYVYQNDEEVTLHNSLTAENDKGTSFEKIAKIIEEKF